MKNRNQYQKLKEIVKKHSTDKTSSNLKLPIQNKIFLYNVAKKTGFKTQRLEGSQKGLSLLRNKIPLSIYHSLSLPLHAFFFFLHFSLSPSLPLSLSHTRTRTLSFSSPTLSYTISLSLNLSIYLSIYLPTVYLIANSVQFFFFWWGREGGGGGFVSNPLVGLRSFTSVAG